MLQCKVGLLLLLLSVVASFLLTVQRHFQNPFLICSAYFYNVMHPQKLKVTLVLLKMTRLAVLGAAGTVCLLASVTRARLTVAQSQAWLNTEHRAFH